MMSQALSLGITVSSILLLVSCTTSSSVSPTGLAGGQMMCPGGPRLAIDCRGVLQQHARDFKADLSVMSQAQVGLGLTTTKLVEADALTSDLLQHSYQICALYNGCIVPPEQYVAQVEQLQSVQLQVRKALISSGVTQQQNIQINPLLTPLSGPASPGSGLLSPSPGLLTPSLPGPALSGLTSPGAALSSGSSVAAPAPVQPDQPQGLLQPGQPSRGTAQPGDTILNVLREGSQALRTLRGEPSRPERAPSEDLDTTLRSMLQSLKQEITRRSPALASSRVVVGNFTEEGQSWSGPLGALLQARVSALVLDEGLFAGVQTRGISVKEVSAVSNPNDPKMLPALYGADLAITGTYRAQGETVMVKLLALQGTGEIARIDGAISAGAIPGVVAASPVNAQDTGQLINSLNQVGSKADTKLVLTTNRPGAGASFRLGEEIQYFVNSTTDGYLYLFHANADKSIARIFPNQFQREARIQAGQIVQVPALGAPFRFEASPPFGLETTFAIVTPSALSEKDSQAIETAFREPQQAPAYLKARGINIVQAGPSAAGAPVLWDSITVLIRP